MAEAPAIFCQIESPPAGQRVPHGAHQLRGWAWAAPGEHLVDIRARSGERTFAGVYGFPRSDIAAHFRIGREFALAGFTIVVDLPPGRHAIIIEALTIAGRWRAACHLTLEAESAPLPAKIATPAAEVRWHEYGRLLQNLLRAQSRHPHTPLEELLTAALDSLPQPRDLLQAPPPFRGHLDEPAAIAPCRFGRLPIFGYLLHSHTEIRSVFASVDLQAWQTIPHRKPSPGPAQYFPDIPGANICGLAGFVDVPAQLPQPVPLRVYAELVDGSLHLVIASRAQTVTREDEKAPYPDQKTHLFRYVHWRLLAAMKWRHLDIVQDAAFEAEVERLAAEFDRIAPPAPLVVAPLRHFSRTVEHEIPRRVLLVSHNLDLEGAPLFLVELAQPLAAAGAQVTFASPADGPLRARLEHHSWDVLIVPIASLLRAQTPAEGAVALAELAFDPRAFDIVVANTFTTFWAVHAAQRADVPTLLYVHESTTPAAFYGDRVPPAVVTLAEEAFARADCVSFTTQATRRYHLHYGRPERHVLCPGWVDVVAIDAWRHNHPRAALRAEFGLHPGELLVTNVGTVSDRKGQQVFARAVDLLWRRAPDVAARTRFVMLGGGSSPFDDLLQDLLRHLARPNLHVHPAKSDYYSYYAATDVFVCSTYEESTPRVVLEAMTCGAAVVASAVHGIPELAHDGEEALLVPPGDSFALAIVLERALTSPDLRERLATAARERVTREHDARTVLQQHLALLASVSRR